MSTFKPFTLRNRLQAWRRANSARLFWVPWLWIGIAVITAAGCDGSQNSSSGSSSSSGAPVVSRPNIAIKNIVINEAAALNSEYTDLEGDTPDWIELYNASDTTTNLGGWSISDDEDEPDKWVFPSINLNADEYIRVWASDKGESGTYYTPTLEDGETSPQQSLHTNFKISSDGETLFLFDPSSTLIHSLEARETRRKTSVGLSTQTGEQVLFMQPTPGSRNAHLEFDGYVNSEVTIAHHGGVNTPESISLEGAGESEFIRYTLDGSIPYFDSPIYAEPITVEETQVIRASVFRDDHIPGPVASRTFLFGQQHDIAVVTLVTDPVNFFDEQYGIYAYGDEFESSEPYYGANFWEDWERDIHVSFYEPDGTLGFELDAGVKIFGGWSRARDQRSLSIFARDKYGTDRIEYPLFPNRDYTEFKSFVLRNSGNDWMRTMMRDAAATSLMAGTSLDYQDFRPAAVYLNGEYWGLYNLREKVNEDFLESRHGFDKDEFTILEGGGEIVEGDNDEYLELIEFLQTSDLENDENYQYLADQIDVENFTIYQIAQIYFDNKDWPGNNIKFWKTAETEWRWILFDTDFGFGIYDNEYVSGYQSDTLSFALEENGPPWPNPPWSTLMLRRLMENQTFKNRFITRFADELNSRFTGDLVATHIESVAQPMRSEIPRHLKRWYVPEEDQPENPSESEFLQYWDYQVEHMKTFAQLRPEALRQHIANQFDLEGIYSLDLTNSESSRGAIQVNTLTIDTNLWSGQYFSGIPVAVKAIPTDGYRFAHWIDGEGTSIEDANLELDLTENKELTAVFEEDFPSNEQ